VEGQRYVLDPERKLAHRMPVHVRSRAGNGPHWCYTNSFGPHTLDNDVITKTETLGSRIIEGVSVCGEKTTLTYPAGSMYGNDKPVNTVREEWTAAEDIGFIILMRSVDPHGTSVSGLKEVSRGEPDPALFRPPQDYRVIDETGPFTVALPPVPERPHRTPTVTALTGLPYSAEAVTEFERQLADGTRLVTHSTTMYYRDAMGRTRQDPQAPLNIEIVDAVAGYRYRLDVTKQIAYRTAIHVDTKPASALALPAATQQRGAASSTEYLGTQTIDGFVTSGTRHTATYAPGTMGGNDRPMTYMNESWYAPQLQIQLRSRSMNPMFGQATSTLKNIKLAEPAPGLFRIPEGYRIVDEDNR
jgi:hypothetical protein